MNLVEFSGTYDSVTGDISLISDYQADFFGLFDGFIYLFLIVSLVQIFWLVLIFFKK